MSSQVNRWARAARRVLALPLAIALVWTPSGLGAQDADADPPVQLRTGDLVRLAVEAEPDLSGEYPVGTEGIVLLPLGGPIQVAGRDFDEVEREIRARLGRELAPGLAIQVVPIFRVAVLGEVRMPGLHPVDATLRVADVLAMAGGFTPLADRSRIELIREERTHLEIDEELTGSGGPPLRPGDRVVVGRVGWFRENLGVVIGAVGSLTVAIVTGLIVR
jgi:polysaccharide export outer membrane protein